VAAEDVVDADLADADLADAADVSNPMLLE
jgi:hypothetical protein